MSAVGQDPELHELREQVAGVDRQILDAINARIELVARIRRYKAENGIDFLDPGREEWLLQHLVEANPGPLSDAGVRELFATILDLVKRELAQGEVTG